LVVENPITSTPGIAFLLATIAAYGEDGFIDYWKSLLANKIEIADGWSTAYYTNFSAGGGMGPQPMFVSYDASPAAAPFYAESEMETAPTASILSDGMCYQVVEFLGILKGTQNQELAEKFVDAILGKEWQEDLPGQMFVFQ
jgi:thiamine transport system substrate-binding protein